MKFALSWMTSPTPADDSFELQLLGSAFYSVSGGLLAECGGGIAISQECETGGSTTGGGTGGTTGGNPPPPTVECDDFVTGGGWILGTPSGVKANFGVHGGIKNGQLWGGLNYLDHKTRMHVKSQAVTGYTHLDAVGRQINFNVTIDGQPGTAVVKVWDNGEPGRMTSSRWFFPTVTSRAVISAVRGQEAATCSFIKRNAARRIKTTR